jgi:hypothetical protein
LADSHMPPPTKSTEYTRSIARPPSVLRTSYLNCIATTAYKFYCVPELHYVLRRKRNYGLRGLAPFAKFTQYAVQFRYAIELVRSSRSTMPIGVVFYRDARQGFYPRK